MGPLAVQQNPKLWRLNYFTDKAELEALGAWRPGEKGRSKKKKRVKKWVGGGTYD